MLILLLGGLADQAQAPAQVTLWCSCRAGPCNVDALLDLLPRFAACHRWRPLIKPQPTDNATNILPHIQHYDSKTDKCGNVF